MADPVAEQPRPGAEVTVDNVSTRTAIGQYEILTEEDSTRSHVETTGESSYEEFREVVELEFEKVKPKLATHSMHCPNCESEITKVILRRKVLSFRSIGPGEPRQEEQKDLVGCFSCFSLFTCSDDGCFNPFDVFRRRTGTSIDPSSRPDGERKMELSGRENANDPKLEDRDQPEPVYVNRESIISYGQVQAPKHITATGPKLELEDQPEPVYMNRESIISYGQVQAPKYVTETTSIPKGIYRLLSSDLPESSNAEEDDDNDDDDTTVIIENEPETVVVARRRSWLGYEGVLVEILKSIVYGGLMEVIASLSVVASAAASNAATLSIVSLALASLIGGVFIIGHNIWDLRDDCYKASSSQETKKAATNKYKELLGQVNYFPLHVCFAILSFIVFGMVPPVAYGYSFHETNDKDFTLMVAAIMSLLCVLLLAILKAYINKCNIFEYFKTVMYYIIISLSVSGVSYVVGNMIARLMEELGWFDTSSGGSTPCLPRTTTPYLESF
ncbi:hypothetical protein SSX86_011276 [Deinandra increscens subsp. villosa]|uniref:Membrane protein of ER body-like protein n=1 Tax=Deinandra increscens subsp. villosa TaxID=3103831 RepID=A0AAP0GZR5_9ASTR